MGTVQRRSNRVGWDPGADCVSFRRSVGSSRTGWRRWRSSWQRRSTRETCSRSGEMRNIEHRGTLMVSLFEIKIQYCLSIVLRKLEDIVNEMVLEEEKLDFKN